MGGSCPSPVQGNKHPGESACFLKITSSLGRRMLLNVLEGLSAFGRKRTFNHSDPLNHSIPRMTLRHGRRSVNVTMNYLTAFLIHCSAVSGSRRLR